MVRQINPRHNCSYHDLLHCSVGGHLLCSPVSQTVNQQGKSLWILSSDHGASGGLHRGMVPYQMRDHGSRMSTDESRDQAQPEEDE